MEIFQYEFMQRAFIAGLAIAVVSPLIGTFLVARRLALMADTLAHISLTGVALGFLLGVSPTLMTLVLAIGAALLIEYLRDKDKLPGETVLAMFLPGGLAVSVVLLSLGSGNNLNIMSYLFGSVTTVSWMEVFVTLILAVVVVATVARYYKQFLFSAVDEETAQVSGIKVKQVNTILIVLTAVVVAVAMRVVGVLLVGALMVIPVMSASRVANSFKSTIIWSILMSVLAVILGLGLAYYLGLPAGGAIVISALAIFVVTLIK